MALTSLLVGADAQAVEVLSRILHDLDIRTEQCVDLEAGLARLQEHAYDALLVDCRQEAPAIALMARARRIPASQTSLIIALVDDGNDVREVFAKGANFVLYKPVSMERANHSLRAARALMRRERRRNPRAPVHAEARISYANIEDALATLIDLSEEGVAIQSERRLPPKCRVYFQFSLPGQVSVVRLSGEVMWQDSGGRIGIRFDNVPQTSRQVLQAWLRASVPRGDQSQPPWVSDSLGGLGLLASSSADRRGKGRRACRLSADVYRMGSGVPQHCTLSDISNGGCYVETTAPFPAGTGIELVVRTSDMKLRVRGSVQAMHPGFGMGVCFSLQTAEEREQVQRLIDYQPPDLMTELGRR
jgi:CheY-like chemotaxis protein